MTPAETKFNQVVEALQLEELSDEEQEEFMMELSDIVFRGTVARLAERMDDETRDAFTALLEGDASDEEVDAFLEERVPGADEAVEETLREISQDIEASLSSAA